MSEHEPVAGLSREALWDDLFDTLDAAHAETYHIHASECCWPFGGALDTILDWHAAHVARATADAEAIARLAEESEAGWRREADEQALRANNAEARLARAWEEGAYAGRDYQKRLHEYASSTHIGRSQPEHVLNPYAAPSAPDPQEER